MENVMKRNTPILVIKSNEYNLRRFILSSRDDNDKLLCTLVFAGFGKYITLNLPNIIKPRATKVTPNWDAATVERLGRDYYWKYDRREFGVSYYDGHVSIKYGVQTDSSDEDKSWGFFLPWTQNKFVRRTIFNSDGTLFANFPHHKGYFLGNPSGWDAEHKATEEVQKVTFKFLDFDGEALEASCFLEEREWSRGESWCSWLKYFYKPIIRRSMDIAFSGETGKRKGSWKGGTLGHGIDMLDVMEDCESAFKRYCLEHNMTYVGKV